jgi:hypothetical protein
MLRHVRELYGSGALHESSCRGPERVVRRCTPIARSSEGRGRARESLHRHRLSFQTRAYLGPHEAGET